MIYIVQSLFNQHITDKLTAEAKEVLVGEDKKVHVIQVPGAMEIPQTMMQILETEEQCQGIIGIGCVIKGDTYHFELVSNETSRAIMDISLESPVPIINGILPTYDEKQAIQRAESHGTKQTTFPKGKEYGQAMIAMLNVWKKHQW